MSRDRPLYSLPDWSLRLLIKLAPRGSRHRSLAEIERWHRSVVEAEEDVGRPAYPVARVEGEQ